MPAGSLVVGLSTARKPQHAQTQTHYRPDVQGMARNHRGSGCPDTGPPRSSSDDGGRRTRRSRLLRSAMDGEARPAGRVRQTRVRYSLAAHSRMPTTIGWRNGNAAVCKTVMSRFDPGADLHTVRRKKASPRKGRGLCHVSYGSTTPEPKDSRWHPTPTSTPDGPP